MCPIAPVSHLLNALLLDHATRAFLLLLFLDDNVADRLRSRDNLGLR